MAVLTLVVEMKIGRTEVGELRIMRMEDGATGANTYDYVLRMFDTPDQKGNRHAVTKIGTVTHNYDDGALKLVQRVMALL